MIDDLSDASRDSDLSSLASHSTVDYDEIPQFAGPDALGDSVRRSIFYQRHLAEDFMLPSYPTTPDTVVHESDYTEHDGQQPVADNNYDDLPALIHRPRPRHVSPVPSLIADPDAQTIAFQHNIIGGLSLALREARREIERLRGLDRVIIETGSDHGDYDRRPHYWLDEDGVEQVSPPPDYEIPVAAAVGVAAPATRILETDIIAVIPDPTDVPDDIVEESDMYPYPIGPELPPPGPPTEMMPYYRWDDTVEDTVGVLGGALCGSACATTGLAIGCNVYGVGVTSILAAIFTAGARVQVVRETVGAITANHPRDRTEDDVVYVTSVGGVPVNNPLSFLHPTYTTIRTRYEHFFSFFHNFVHETNYHRRMGWNCVELIRVYPDVVEYCVRTRPQPVVAADASSVRQYLITLISEPTGRFSGEHGYNHHICMNSALVAYQLILRYVYYSDTGEPRHLFNYQRPPHILPSYL